MTEDTAHEPQRALVKPNRYEQMLMELEQLREQRVVLNKKGAQEYVLVLHAACAAQAFRNYCIKKLKLAPEDIHTLALKQPGYLEDLIKHVSERTSNPMWRMIVCAITFLIPIVGWCLAVVTMADSHDKWTPGWTFDHNRRRLEKYGEGHRLLPAITNEIGLSMHEV